VPSSERFHWLFRKALCNGTSLQVLRTPREVNCRNQAITLKLRSLSIQFTSERFLNHSFKALDFVSSSVGNL